MGNVRRTETLGHRRFPSRRQSNSSGISRTHWRNAKLLALTGVFSLAALTSTIAGNIIDQIAMGRSLYQEHCARCHGANLEGQPNWMRRRPDGRLAAPPHDVSGHTWHHSDRQLFAITMEGPSALLPGYESDMPGFAGVLSDDEIRAVLDYIKSTWPQRQQDSQASRSKADPPN